MYDDPVDTFKIVHGLWGIKYEDPFSFMTYVGTGEDSFGIQRQQSKTSAKSMGSH